MTFDTAFDELWGGGAPQPTLPLCPFAEEFQKWAEELCASTEQARTPAAVNVAKVLLVDKYFEWRTFVPRRHRTISGTSGGHTCIWNVFEMTYRRIKIVELAISPPPLTPPQPALPAPAPSPTLPPNIAGIFLGELE
jgi:hypothetical protein